ncbi:MAG: hypothetical protein AAFU72_01860 [Pseudomonadota bacterium]
MIIIVYDGEGAVVAESGARPSDAEIAAALARFEGETLQVPPLYSAVKHDGARAYDLARRAAAGEDVELPDLAPRPLFVHRIALLARPDADRAEIEMICGKGGYVRAVARDLGRMLGCHAHVSTLRRMAAGPFALADAVTPDALEVADPEALILPLEVGLRGLPEVAIGPAAAEDLRHGRPVALPDGAAGACWASSGGRAVALATCVGGLLRPDRVIAPVD